MAEVLKLLSFIRTYWQRSAWALLILMLVVVIDLMIPRLIQHLIDFGIGKKDFYLVMRLLLLMIVLSLVQTVLAIANNYLSVSVGEGLARDLRKDLYAKIQSFSFSNLDRLKTSQLMVRLTSDVGAFQRLVQVSLRIGTRAPLLMLGSIALMFETAENLAYSMLPLLLVTSGIIWFFIKKLGGMFFKVQQKLDRLNLILQENISGARVVKAFVRGDFEVKRFRQSNSDYADQNVAVMQFMTLMTPSLSFILNIGIILVVWVGGVQTIHGELSTGQLVAFINYLQTTMAPLMIIVFLSNTWAAGFASAGRINELFDTTSDIIDADNSVALPTNSPLKVVFSNVSFQYGSLAIEHVLDQINLEITPGEKIGIIGATGAGKSTLINLIPRFYEATGGELTINGINIRQIRQSSLLSCLAVVPQESVLFSGTIAENICYGNPDATKEQMIQAAKCAAADEFINSFPEKYDAHIEQRGINLSGGQKQRLAIARALLLNSSLLILDDSTSSVDVETEARIYASLKTALRGSTIIVVAQRISTIKMADKIVVMDRGRIVAIGRHELLFESCGLYREICKSQFVI